MTHTEKGYADAKSGAIDSGLYGDAGVQGREYRNGIRQFNRDETDRKEAAVSSESERIVESVVAANEGRAPKTAYEAACLDGGHGEREGTPILDMKLAEVQSTGQPSPIDQAINAEKVMDLIDNAIVDAGPGGVCGAPVPAPAEGDEVDDEEPEEDKPADAPILDGGDQFALFDHKPSWTELWKGMPEFEQKDLKPWQTIPVHVTCRADRERLAKLLEQTITDDTRSLWFPKASIDRYVDKRWVTEKPVRPRYPIYVISKGRWESRMTVRALEAIGLDYYVVIEPQELPKYAEVIARPRLLALPFSNLGQGSIPARNWVWEHAKDSGAARHWILDDNIDGFFRLHNNLKVPVRTGATFAAAEDFVDRYENIAIAGMQYFMFASRKAVVPPLSLNTRIYSCILIRNDLPYRWRGRYNEDTDLSLRALKDGHCTVLFNAFLAYKMTTMTMSGGNTEALYKIKEGEKDGRLLMAESLRDQHPDLVEIVWKWDRWQHSVNYKIFKQRLRLKAGVEIPAEANNYGMEIAYISDEDRKKEAGK